MAEEPKSEIPPELRDIELKEFSVAAECQACGGVFSDTLPDVNQAGADANHIQSLLLTHGPVCPKGGGNRASDYMTKRV